MASLESPKAGGLRLRPSRAWTALRTATTGATSIEYALIAASVVLVIIVALVQLGDSVRNLPFPALIAAFQEANS